MKARRNLVQEYFSEKLVVGGLLYTRVGLVLDMRAQGCSEREIEWTLAYNKTTSEMIENAVNQVPNEIPEEVREMLK